MKWAIPRWTLVVLMPLGTATAQQDVVTILYDRVERLYERGATNEQIALLDSTEAAARDTGELNRLVQVLRARLSRGRGMARRSLTVLDTIVADTSGDHPIVRFACLAERVRALKQLGRFPRALIEAKEALSIARRHGLRDQEISALVLQAEIHRKLWNINAALDLLMEAERLERMVGYPMGRCNIIINRGNILYDQGLYDEALVRFREAHECALSGGFPGLAVNTYFNIGSALSQMDPDSIAPAIRLYEQAFKDPFVQNDRRYQADLYVAIASLRKYEERYDLALEATQRSLDIHHELQDTLSMALDLVILAACQRNTGQAERALTSAERSLSLARSSQSLEDVANALNEIAKDLEQLGRYEEANNNLHKFIAVKDSIADRSSDDRTMDAEYKYQLVKKEAAIAWAEAKNRRRDLQLLASAVIGALLVGMLGLGVRNIQHLRKRQAQTRQLHEQEVNQLLKQQEIRSFDAMMMGQERERARVAKDLHDRLGTMLSTVRLRFSAMQGRIETLGDRSEKKEDQAFQLLDEAVVEVRRISHDMVRGNLARFGLTVALQDLADTLRVPGKMEVELGVFGLEARLEGNMEVAIYRMVQEVVGNVLKHAKASELSIQVNRAPASINVMVEDNGVGFDPARGSEGMGMGNLRERAAAFRGAVTVDSHAGRGTTVTIDLPLGARSHT